MKIIVKILIILNIIEIFSVIILLVHSDNIYIEYNEINIINKQQKKLINNQSKQLLECKEILQGDSLGTTLYYH